MSAQQTFTKHVALRFIMCMISVAHVGRNHEILCFIFITTAQCVFFLKFTFLLLKVCRIIIENLENNEKLEEGNKN